MATIISYTAAKQQEIEEATTVGGSIVVDDLILTPHTGSTFNAGVARGPQGDQGPPGEITDEQLEEAISVAHGEGAISSLQLADNSIVSEKIAPGAFTETKIANLEIDSTVVEDRSIATSKVKNNAVTTAKLKDLAIGEESFGSISASKIAVTSQFVNNNVRYFRQGGIVVVFSKAGAAGWNPANPVTLPVGYRPLTTVDALAFDANNGDWCVVRINTNGTLQVRNVETHTPTDVYFTASYRIA